MRDRAVRSLVSLEQSASTARVLNLRATHRNSRHDPALETHPFFHNKVLNECILVKHRVRPHERDLFPVAPATATKILVPIDAKDLRHGARFIMLGQKDFEEAVGDAFGDALRPGAPDRHMLELIDQLPSLDPFLLREHLKRHGFDPARAYFAITDADIQRMFEFVRGEVMGLVTLSGGQKVDDQAARRLADKLLSNSVDSGFEPLKITLKLSDKDYQDGVFCWRGFLYYKWVLHELTPAIEKVAHELEAIRPRGPSTPEASIYLPLARRRIDAAVAATVAGVHETLAVYDRAYRSLTEDGQPTAFRDFLLAAPTMFMGLGEQTGALQHMVSFWRYRFPQGRGTLVSPEELMDIFLDFEDGLACGEVPGSAHAA